MRKINLCKCCGKCPVVLEFENGKHAIVEESDGTTIYFNEEQWENLRRYFLSKEE